MFIVEDGTIVTDANSLVSVEFADAYHAERQNNSWATHSPERKEALLIRATDYLTGVYANALIGVPMSSAQLLPFPRYINYTNVGVPTTIKATVAELALIAGSQSLVPTISRGKKRVKVGPLEVEYDGNSPSAPRFTAAMLKLIPYLKGTAFAGTVKLQRA